MDAPAPGPMAAGVPPSRSWNQLRGWFEYILYILMLQIKHKAAVFQSILAVGTMATSLFAVYGNPDGGFEDPSVRIMWICAVTISCFLGFFWSLKSNRPYSFSLVATVVAFVIHGKLSNHPDHVFMDTILELPLCILSGSIMAWLYFKSISSGHREQPLEVALEHIGVIRPDAA